MAATPSRAMTAQTPAPSRHSFQAICRIMVAAPLPPAGPTHPPSAQPGHEDSQRLAGPARQREISAFDDPLTGCYLDVVLAEHRPGVFLRTDLAIDERPS